MISRRILLSLLSAAMLAVSILPKSSRAQAPSTQAFNKLAPAFALDTAGHSVQAIAAAEELLRSGTLSRTEQADVLDFEAMCYRKLDQPDKAVHALEAAEAVLRPEDAKEQAATLHILGQIYVSRGNGADGAHFVRAGVPHL